MNNIKRNYIGKKNSDIINFPVQLRKNFLSPKDNVEILKMPISAHRIIFKILNDISFDQFQTSKSYQKKQITLFEQDFLTENNTYASFKFKVSEISNNRDYTNIIKGLEFLENYKKGWYESFNSKGKIIKSYGGLLSNVNISEGYITFLISAFWLEKITHISAYNNTIFLIPWILSKNKHVLFYLWLLEIPDNGTKIKFTEFQKVFQYSYKSSNSLAKNLFKTIKTKLDEYSNLSFNYSVKGDIIHIVPYYTKNINIPLKKKTITKQQITQKLHYWKVRHNLSKKDIYSLRSIINYDKSSFNILKKSYNSMVNNSRGNNKMTDFKGEIFMALFQEEIIKVYKNSVWFNSMPNGYPKII